MGSVEVSKRLPDGKIQIITKLDRNDIFGEMGLIDQLPRSATVRALEDSSISVMTQGTFNSLAKKPQALIYANLQRFWRKNLRNTLKIIEGVDEQKPDSQAVIAGNIWRNYTG